MSIEKQKLPGQKEDIPSISEGFTNSAKTIENKGEKVLDASKQNYDVGKSVYEYFYSPQEVKLSKEFKESLNDVDAKKLAARLDKIKIFTNRDLIFKLTEATKLPVSRILPLMEQEYKKDTIHPELSCFKYLFDNIKKGNKLTNYPIIGEVVDKLSKESLSYRNEFIAIKDKKYNEVDRYEKYLNDMDVNIQGPTVVNKILADRAKTEYREGLTADEYSKETQNYIFSGLYKYAQGKGCETLYFYDFVAATVKSSREKGITLAGN